MGPKAHTTKDAMASKICILYSEHVENTHTFNQLTDLWTLETFYSLCYRDIDAEEVYIVP